MELGRFDTICSKLVLSVREIESNEIENCRQLIKPCDQGHRGAQWTLEHAYWRDFGKDSSVKELAEELAQLRETLEGNKNDEEVDSESDSET